MHRPIPRLISEERLTSCATLFLDFLDKVPNERKRALHFKSPFHRGSASGYCDVRSVPGKDPMEYFHWTPDLKDRRVYRDLNALPAAQAFFDSAEYIYTYAEEMALQVFRRDLREYYDRCFDRRGHLINGFLRVLCYSPTAAHLRAKGHYDKGQGAIALAESSPGLRVGCCASHSLEPVQHQDGTAMFMPGQLLWEDSHGTIIPSWQDVVPDTVTSPMHPRCARWAIVLFINDKDGRYPEWDATHTPLPVHAPFEPKRQVAS